MALTPGTRLGVYDITAQIGEGGMGQVYRATDTTLGRQVAIKILPDAFASDPERLARFEREAKTLASLNHPNIAAIYGLEKSGGLRALVMELVEGDDLSQRIARGAIPIDEALLIAKQIADALEAAHEQGIVHRDLKPANIKVRPDGAVKVLDFGLAKAIEAATADSSTSPTASGLATQAGIILGTAAYMSPEQAKGKSVDRRTDTWAFGCVLYEMLTGTMTFKGDTISDTLAAVIRGEPDWTVLPQNTPLQIRDLLRRCLTKDPKGRMQAIGDARIAIEETLARGVEDTEAAPAPVRPTGWLRVLPWAIAVAGVCAAMLFLALRPAPRVLPLRKFQRNVENLQAGMYGVGGPAISADGKRVAYQSGNRIFVWEFDQLEVHPVFEIEGTGQTSTPLIWSPDSTSLAFRNRDKLLRVPAAGGQPVQLCKLPFNLLQSGAWSPAGKIYLAAHFGDIYELSDGGGDARPLGLFHPSTEVDFHGLSMLPDGHLMYMVHTVGAGTRVDVLLDGKPKTMFSSSELSSALPAYAPDGYLIIEHEGKGIWAHPFSLAKVELTGEPFLIVARGTAPTVSSDGTLFYILPAPDELRQAVWVSRNGEILSSVGKPELGLQNPALSPDGKKLAVAAVDEDGNEFIAIGDLARGSRVQLTSSAQTEYSAPGWMPDGRVVFSYFTNISSTIALRAADGTGTTQNLFPGAWPNLSPRGNYLQFTAFTGDGTVNYLALERGRLPPDPLKPRIFLDDPGSKIDLHISPDETLAAYVTRNAKQMGVCISRFPSGEGRWEVTAVGESPIWNPRGGEVFFTSKGSMMSVDVVAKPSLTLSAPKKLFDLEKAALQAAPLSGRSLFGVSPDGQRFLMIQRVGKHDTSRAMVVVQDWHAEFANRNRH